MNVNDGREDEPNPETVDTEPTPQSVARRAEERAARRRAADAVNEPILANALYRAKDVQKRLELGTWSWRKLRRDGLQTVKKAGRSFVLGSEIIRHFEASQRENAGPDR